MDSRLCINRKTQDSKSEAFLWRYAWHSVCQGEKVELEQTLHLTLDF